MSSANIKKLIEVALPLEAINKESAREKSIRHGHPSTLHLWWARRPLAACRAVLFASLVDDPSSHPEQFPTEEDQDRERERLFQIIEDLVKWENSNNETVIQAARAEILKSTDGNPPPVLDPFCGGGSIPLEAQRLGLRAYASDLNPVAVLITKALIEIPPKFAGRAPVNPDSRKKLDHSKEWRGAQGLAEDVRYYGQWMRDEAGKRIGHLYPKVKLLKEYGGGEATVIAWLWARTVKCPNPACGAQMPLVRSFWLSTKPNKKAWVEPVVDTKRKTVRFEVRAGKGSPPEPPKVGRGAKFRCLVCGETADDQHIKDEGSAKRMGARLMAIVAEGTSGRIYLPPTPEHEAVAANAGEPAAEFLVPLLPDNTRWFSPPVFGLKTYRDLFTPRQLVALTTFCDLVGEARERVLADGRRAGLPDKEPLDKGGTGAIAYADAVATYLAFGLSKASSRNCSFAIWEPGMGRLAGALGRQALPMSWDFAETNPLAGAGGDIAGTSSSVAEVVERLGWPTEAAVRELDATALELQTVPRCAVATDPPYYDNIGYADLSDFFYVWLRRSIGIIYPDLFSTLLTPKAQELVATPYRFDGSKERAETFFEEGLGKALGQLWVAQNHSCPMTLFYAFKQTESEGGEENGDGKPAIASTGWETMLEGLLRGGFTINGSWPMRTELVGSLKKNVSALASSVVLVCRPRSTDAPLATRREFLAALKNELPDALKKLKQGNIAPVDLAQAAIGPGMAVFSRYAKVLEADGSAMTVRAALGLINQTLDEVLAEQESEFDADTRWALAWFEQFGMEAASYGVAETLSKAKNTAVNGLEEAGILASKAGRVRLLRRDELAKNWNPAEDGRLTVWEVTQYLIRALEQDGESGAAELLRKLGSVGEVARDLAYRLYTICDRNKWSEEARAYNGLVTAWPEITRLAHNERPEEKQTRFSL